ncbi:MAG: hypothetical protein WKF91_16465 [Segetibacter sp.]
MLFTWINKGVKDKNSWVWFKRWILERGTLTQLSQQSKLQRKALQKLFKNFLSSVPTISIVSKKSAHLIIDATFLKAIDVCFYTEIMMYVLPSCSGLVTETVTER